MIGAFYIWNQFGDSGGSLKKVSGIIKLIAER